MNCPVCHTTTTPRRIGTSDYCSACGTRYPGGQAAVSRTHKSIDIASRSTKSATELHRGRGKSVIDLREHPAKRPTQPQVEHARHHPPALLPSTASQLRHESAYTSRLETAKQVGKSPLINRFGTSRRTDMVPPEPTAPVPAVASPARATVQSSVAAQPPIRELPNHIITQHEALRQFIPAPSTEPLPEPSKGHRQADWRPHLGLSPHKGRVLATTAAVALMGGYIWLQNYPKLALQTASNQAGLAATLPGYIPSSYNLSKTLSQPGLVTLNFSSPSIPEILRIAQHRTSWDSNSLLDNFVARQTDDYSTVHGQGLTIYLFGQNEATWVNHGIWYNIEGASKLSREQILKIAYSL